MRGPITQEEISYRENFTNRVSAISNVNSLFTDVENKARRLTILKSLVLSLELGGEIIDTIQKEIEAAEEEALLASEEELAAENEGGDDLFAADEGEEELSAMPDEEIAAESFTSNGGAEILMEEHILQEDVTDLPTPEELDDGKDFTANV